MSTHRSSAIVLTLAAALLLVVLASACGIPTEATARPIDRNVLNQALVESTTTTVPSGSDATTRTALLFLVSSKGESEMLSSLKADIVNVVDEAGYPRQVIEQLIAQPSEENGGNDLTNAIPSGTRVLNATRDGRVLDLDLSDLGRVESSRQRLAAAQIVYTATAIAGIDGVRFSIDGELAAVPLDDHASDVGQIITGDDYPNMVTA